MRKIIALGIMLLFLGMTISSSGFDLEKQSTRDVITVDNEGDGDYISIKEALSNANPGDIIEVYSGTYPEQEIRIVNDNISLLGISHELGEGDDSGKPFINGNGTGSVIQVEASYVIVSNFKIENPWSKPKFACGIYINIDYYPFEPRNVTISECNISNSPHAGIYMYEPYGENITIINNHISHCNNDGIEIHSQSCTITGNIVTDCDEIGILVTCFSPTNISGNRIERCKIGIQFGSEYSSIVYGNDIESCAVGIQNAGWGSIITKNNFKNYSQIGFWFYKPFLYPVKNYWRGNYWDTWTGIGPKKLLGLYVIGWRFPIQIPLLIPWVEFDWHPAKEPHDIPRIAI